MLVLTCLSATTHVAAVLNEQRVSETADALFTPLSSPNTSIIKVAIDHFVGQHQDISSRKKNPVLDQPASITS